MIRKEISHINEGNNAQVTITPDEDTSGETIIVRLKQEDVSGTGNSVGSASGVSAGSSVTITMATKTYSPDDYLIEVWVDYGGPNQRILNPEPNVNKFLKITPRYGIAN